MTHRASVTASAQEKPGGEWIHSTCGMCLHGCGIKVYVENGVALKIEGDPGNLDNLGKLCPKGNAGLRRLYDPNRIRKPMKRTNPKRGPDEDPGWVEIEWEEALETTARELKKIRDEDPRKLLASIGDFQRIVLWGWPSVFGTPNVFSSIGNYCGGSYHPVNGAVDGSFAAINDYEYCNYWIQIGSGDGFSSHLHVPGSTKRMADARMRGMRLVTLDPRCSVAAAKADEWICALPGTDRAFVLGMAHVLVHELERFDREFLRDHTNAPYIVQEDGDYLRDTDGVAQVWDALAGAPRPWNGTPAEQMALEGSFEVDGGMVRTAFQVWKDLLADHTPERMSEITTVPAATIRRIATEFVDAAQIGATIELEGRTYPFRPAALNYYRGSQSHANGLFDNMAYKLINMLVGNIDVPGGHLGVPLDTRGFFIGPGEDGVVKAEPHQLHPQPDFKSPCDSTHLLEWFPIGFDASQLNVETLLHPERFGLDYQPEAMFIYHCNPLWNLPETDRLEEIMGQMKFVVAIDIQDTESTRWADIFLPASTYLESTLLNCSEPPVTTGHSMRQPVVETVGDTRDAFDILSELTERIGFLNEFNGFLSMASGFDQRPELMLEPGKRYSAEEYWDRVARCIYGDDRDLAWFREHGNAVRHRTLDETYLPYGDLRVPFYGDYVLKAGKGLASHMQAAGVDDWPLEDYEPLPYWLDNQVVQDGERGYDLYAITFKEALHTFADTVTLSWLKEVSDKDENVHGGILINRATAQARGIENGQRIRLVSPGGSLEGRAQVIEGIHPQVVGVSNAITRSFVDREGRRVRGAHFNRLLSGGMDYTDTVTGGLESTARVRLEVA